MEDWGAVKARLTDDADWWDSIPVGVKADIRAALERVAEVDRLVDMAGAWIETDPSLRSTACIEAALDHAKELDAEVAALRQRVEELERADDTWRAECEHQTERAEAAEAKLARCVEALGEIRGRSLAAKTHEVGPLEAKGRLTRILELACAALAAAKGRK